MSFAQKHLKNKWREKKKQCLKTNSPMHGTQGLCESLTMEQVRLWVLFHSTDKTKAASLYALLNPAVNFLHFRKDIKLHLHMLIHTVLRRATRSPKFSRDSCFLRGSNQWGETFSRHRAESTLLITINCGLQLLTHLRCFFKCRHIDSQVVFHQRYKKRQWESPWKDIVRKRNIFDSTPWRIWALKAVTLSNDT